MLLGPGFGIFGAISHQQTICLEVDPSQSIASIQRQILEKITATRIQNAMHTLTQQQQLEGMNKSGAPHGGLLSTMNSYWIIVHSYVCNFIINHSIFGTNDIFLIYNGKVLCPYNTVVDYYNPYRSLTNCLNGNKNVEITRKDTPITIHASYPVRGGCFMISFSILMTMLMAVCMSLCTCGMSLVIIPLLAPFLFILPLFCL